MSYIWHAVNQRNHGGSWKVLGAWSGSCVYHTHLYFTGQNSVLWTHLTSGGWKYGAVVCQGERQKTGISGYGRFQPYNLLSKICSGSVQFMYSIMSDSLWPHGLQHTRPLCPSPTPRVCSNSCPLSWWCHQPSHPLLSPSPPAFNLSQHQGLFQWVSSLYQVAKVLEFQLQHRPSNEYSRLISFRMDWLDLLAVQGTVKRPMGY